MDGKTPSEAYRQFRDRQNKALGCITAERLAVPHGPRFVAGIEYAITLNRGAPVPLRGTSRILLTVMLRFRIVEVAGPNRGRFRVNITGYFYEISAPDGAAIFTYQWSPEASPPQRTIPHLHVGQSVVAADAPLPRDRFHKLHIPTGYVSMEHVLRFLIEDLGVRPLAEDWASVLETTKQDVNRHQTS